jgi:hypothetical protein
MLGIIPYAGQGLPPSSLPSTSSGIDLMVFNTLKERWVAKNNKRGENKTPGVMILVRLSPSLPPAHLLILQLLFGATSTTCGQVVAYPLQLVRTRLQADKMTDGYPRYSGQLSSLASLTAT